MDTYSIIAFMLTLATAIAYVNHRYIKMQPTMAYKPTKRYLF